MKYYLLFILLSSCYVTHGLELSLDNSSFFSMYESDSLVGYGLYIPYPSDEIIQKHAWNIFNDAVFNIPIALEYTYKRNLPFVLMIPADYKNVSTIEQNAPLIEGARVALAWTSSFFRLSLLNIPMDVRVFLCSRDKMAFFNLSSNDITNALMASKESPELSMQQRILPFNGKDNGTMITIIPWEVPSLALSKISYIFPKFVSRLPRIIITGGAGFIGSHLAKRFLDKGYQVIALDNLSCCSGENIKDLLKNNNFEFHNIDVSYPFDVEGPVDVIAHLASVPSPDFYYKKPIETLRSGLHATKETLELAMKKNARYLFTSTSEVYGDPEIHPQHELYAGCVDPIGKRSQYDQSKRGAETLIKLYYEKYNIDVRVARIFNTYGPGMELHDGRVITNFISALLEGKDMVVYGNGNQTRSLIYISDMVDGLEMLINSELITTFTFIQQRIFNVGNPEEYSINQVAEMVNDLSLKYLYKETRISHIPQFDLTDPKLRRPDIGYIKKIVGFIPEARFKDGLEKTFLHYKNLINQ